MSIKIGAHKYELHFPYRFKERSDLRGQSVFSTRDLRIGQTDGGGDLQADSSLFQAFVHEFFHTLEDDCGSDVFRGTEAGENLLDALSNAFCAALQDNKNIRLLFRDPSKIRRWLEENSEVRNE